MPSVTSHLKAGSRACAPRGRPRPGARTPTQTSLPLHACLHLVGTRFNVSAEFDLIISNVIRLWKGRTYWGMWDINQERFLKFTWSLGKSWFSISRCISHRPAAAILFDNMWCIFQLPVKRISWCCNKICSPSTKSTHHSLWKPPVTPPQLTQCTLGRMLIWEHAMHLWRTGKTILGLNRNILYFSRTHTFVT